MRIRKLAIRGTCLLLLTTVIASCAVVPAVSTWRTNRDYEPALHAARKAVIDIGFTVTEMDVESGFIIAEQDVVSGGLLGIGSTTFTRRVNIYVTRSNGGSEIEVGMSNPAFFKAYKQALRRRLPDARIVPSQ